MVGRTELRLVRPFCFDGLRVRLSFGELALDHLVGRLTQPGRHAFAPALDFAQEPITTALHVGENRVNFRVALYYRADMGRFLDDLGFEVAQSPDFPRVVTDVPRPHPFDDVGRVNAFRDLEAQLLINRDVFGRQHRRRPEQLGDSGGYSLHLLSDKISVRHDYSPNKTRNEPQQSDARSAPTISCSSDIEQDGMDLGGIETSFSRAVHNGLCATRSEPSPLFSVLYIICSGRQEPQTLTLYCHARWRRPPAARTSRPLAGSRRVSVAYNTLLNHPEENIHVLPGDVITVVRDPQTFTAFGATGRSEKIPFDTASITLEEAARAGGFNDDNAATPPGGNLVPVIYRLNLRDAHSSFLARAFAMKDKDMIYIANWASDQIGS
jgi:hypothetical protein